jgi:MFS transporter, ACS family, hexuronate transporter
VRSRPLTTWLPVVSMMLVSVISYIDRNTLALLAPTILKETGLSAEQYGFIISAFSVAYMIGNPVWGAILDRIGVRKGMLAAVAAWSFASMSHAFASGFASFAAARAVLGFGEGATFPGSMQTAMRTLPPNKRSRGIAISYSGGSLGAIITPIIMTPVAAAWGWRGTFWFTGAIGGLWLLQWFFLSKRKELATGNREQSSDLAQSQMALELAVHGAPSWRHPQTWALIAAYGLGAVPLGFVLYETSLYLSAVLHKTQIEIGAVLWIPPLGWEAGYFFWGWATDRYTRGGASLSAMRRMFLICTLFSLPFALIPRVDSFVFTMAMLFFAMFIAAGFIIGSLAAANSYYSRAHSGLIAGLAAGSWSALVALVMPGFGWLFDRHLYSLAFDLVCVFPILGFASWWVLSRSQSKVHQEPASSGLPTRG